MDKAWRNRVQEFYDLGTLKKVIVKLDDTGTTSIEPWK